MRISGSNIVIHCGRECGSGISNVSYKLQEITVIESGQEFGEILEDAISMLT